jgi:zinc finger BED domain-containing protein 1 (E3 SUMO-protein ligase ZBED1)
MSPNQPAEPGNLPPVLTPPTPPVYHFLPLPQSYKAEYWDLFNILDPLHHPPEKKGDKIALCKLCQAKINFGRGTTGLTRHMSSHEKNSEDAERLMATRRKNKRALFASLNVTTKQSPAQRRQTNLEAVVCWVIEENVPLNMVEKESFRRMCCTLDTNAPKITQGSVREEIKHLGDICKQAVQKELHNRCFALTTDHWTSKNNETYGALTAHYIHDYTLKRCVLHFEVHHGTTSGEALFTNLLQVFHSYNFDLSFVLSVTTDTTGNMNTFGRKLAEHGVIHLYCVDHNLHLNAKIAFDDLNLPESENAMKAARAQVQFFNSSTQALDKLCNMQQTIRPGTKSVKLIQDVQTRWWSTWKMLSRLNTLTPTIDALIASGQVNTTPLTPSQKQVLVEVEKLLEPVKVAQTKLEGDKYPTISFVPFFIWKLRGTLKSHADGDDSFKVSTSTTHLARRMYNDFVSNRYGDGSEVYHDNYVLGNLQRYISLHRIVLVATFLDPRFKKLTPFVPESEHGKVHQYVLSLMHEIVPHNNALNQSNTTDGNDTAPSTFDPLPAIPETDDFFAELGENETTYSDMSTPDTFMICSTELNRYISIQKIQPNCDALQWWAENSINFPILGVLAMRYLAIPATSAPSERLWSLAAHVITKSRTQLDSHLVSDIIFLKENGHILGKHCESIEGRSRTLPTVYEVYSSNIDETPHSLYVDECIHGMD